MTQLEKDRLIEKFMGWELKWVDNYGNKTENQQPGAWRFVNLITKEIDHKTTYSNSVIGFTSDLNWLWKALKKFDNLAIEYDLNYNKYAELCDQIDNSVTLYNIDDAVNALCEGIEWYNLTLN